MMPNAKSSDRSSSSANFPSREESKSSSRLYFRPKGSGSKRRASELLRRYDSEGAGQGGGVRSGSRGEEDDGRRAHSRREKTPELMYDLATNFKIQNMVNMDGKVGRTTMRGRPRFPLFLGPGTSQQPHSRSGMIDRDWLLHGGGLSREERAIVVRSPVAQDVECATRRRPMS